MLFAVSCLFTHAIWIEIMLLLHFLLNHSHVIKDVTVVSNGRALFLIIILQLLSIKESFFITSSTLIIFTNNRHFPSYVAYYLTRETQGVIACFRVQFKPTVKERSMWLVLASGHLPQRGPHFVDGRGVGWAPRQATPHTHRPHHRCFLTILAFPSGSPYAQVLSPGRRRQPRSFSLIFTEAIPSMLHFVSDLACIGLLPSGFPSLTSSPLKASSQLSHPLSPNKISLYYRVHSQCVLSPANKRTNTWYLHGQVTKTHENNIFRKR